MDNNDGKRSAPDHCSKCGQRHDPKLPACPPRGKTLSAVEAEPGIFELRGDYEDTYQTRSALRAGFEVAATFAERDGAPGLAAKLRALVVRGREEVEGSAPDGRRR